MGGNYIAVKDNDINLGIFNPALLNADMGSQVALSYLPYFEGINIGYAAYGHHCDSLKTTFSGTVQYVDYGDFTRRDETGAELGQFSAGEYVIQVGAGRAIDSLFSVGANVKFITSSLENYNSTAWAVDIGGVFVKRKLGLTVAAMLRNIGYQTSTFTDQREKLPFQAQLGITYKFKHAPFRLGLMVEQLQQWDLTYDDPNATVNIDPTTGEVIEDKVTSAEKVFLHLVPSAEILLSENFMLRLGYNFRRRQEMVLPRQARDHGPELRCGPSREQVPHQLRLFADQSGGDLQHDHPRGPLRGFPEELIRGHRQRCEAYLRGCSSFP